MTMPMPMSLAALGERHRRIAHRGCSVRLGGRKPKASSAGALVSDGGTGAEPEEDAEPNPDVDSKNVVKPGSNELRVCA
jgi:hypothetical protein